jgi:hypothetical protein
MQAGMEMDFFSKSKSMVILGEIAVEYMATMSDT